ncbi:MAG: ABC transporter permease [Thermoleophilia bacterium]|nr:ABC transporter permease [Thermoleophilia bacterium]
MKRRKYSYLIKELAITDFKLKFKGSFFGYLWSLAKPLLLFLVLYTVFTRIFRIGGTIPNYPVYLLLGVMLWGFFAETTNVCMTSIVGRGDLIRKVYFPKIILPISSSLSALISLVINLIVVFGFAVYVGVEFSTSLLWMPLVVIEFYILSLGVAFFLASLFVRYRDIVHIWEVFAQALFYATPILYPLALVPPDFARVMMLSPVAQIIQDFRRIIISPTIESSVSVNGIIGLLPYFLTIIIFILGYFVFQRMAMKFAEEV